MENNQLLIGVQFSFRDEGSGSDPNAGEDRNDNLEFLVLRDITLQQLLDGIQYGLKKQIDTVTDQRERHLYRKWEQVYHHCREEMERDAKTGDAYFSHITLTDYNPAAGAGRVRDVFGFPIRRFTFSWKDLGEPICNLGFITSSRIIFDDRLTLPPRGGHDTNYLIQAFQPEQKIHFPEYNISTRQIFRFCTDPVEILPPPDPPKKPDGDLLGRVMPALMTILVMLILRGFFSSGDIAARLRTAAMGIGMGAASLVTALMMWDRQRKGYQESRKDWKDHYQQYIARILQDVRTRQKRDAEKLQELYPDAEQLMSPGGQGVFALNENLYSRSPQDDDFLTFRLGLSERVRSRFEVKGTARDVIFSPASFRFTDTHFQEVELILPAETEEEKRRGTGGAPTGVSRNRVVDETSDLFPLPSLPAEAAKRYQFLPEAPLLLSLHHIRALGVVDRTLYAAADETSGTADCKEQELISRAHYFTTRMIFELCYYHSPDVLQFVVFFPKGRSVAKVDQLISCYKFMPHFRELFADRSQFVFDDDSAGLALGSLLTILRRRWENAAAGEEQPLPHIVLVFYDDYQLKEHAFAQFLPKPPGQGEKNQNQVGMTIVYLARFKEYLLPYCDCIVDLGPEKSVLTMRENGEEKQPFFNGYPSSFGAEIEPRDGIQKRIRESKLFFSDYQKKTNAAFRFFSTIYYIRMSQNGKVPSSIGIFPLYDFPSGDQEGVKNRIHQLWGTGPYSGSKRAADITKSLRIPIGRTDAALTCLDLHENADGPHMLVAGTTGSGKSETILTCLLGLCATFRPDELNLLLVDMKGGGFIKRIGTLPHVAGAVTDVDGDENGTGAEYMLRRFLDAIQSEVKRRKILLNRMRLDSVDAYIAACRDIEEHIRNKRIPPEEAPDIRRLANEEPLSHIILVVDEFTELKQFSAKSGDIDFISQITTIARIGRSLGLHIVLISQNIEGAITEDIRVNSNARLCLKVATRQASREMIGTDLAALPNMPGNGRAYLQAGMGARFDYFQSGYSGFSAAVEDDTPVELILARKYGMYSSFYKSSEDNEEQKRKREEKKKTGISRTQLEALVDAIIETARETEAAHETTPRHTVFYPPLPARIVYEHGRVIDLNQRKARQGEIQMRRDHPAETPGFGETPDSVQSTRQMERLQNMMPPETDREELSTAFHLPMGICDDPHEQRQPLLQIDYLRSHIAVFGEAMTGKTTFVRSFLLRLHRRDRTQTPEECVYILDFGGNLGRYGKLPDVCACFDSSNEENIRRVFKTVEERLGENVRLLKSGQYYIAARQCAARKNPGGCPPHMTLIIENLTAFLTDERYTAYHDRLLRLCRDGLSRGLTVLITANDTTGTGRFLPFFGRKIVFKMPVDSYMELFLTRTVSPMQNPGRGLVNLEPGVFEFQCFLPFADEAEEQTALAEWNRAMEDTPNPRRLVAFEGDLTRKNYAGYCAPDTVPLLPEEIVVGLDYYSHRPVSVDVSRSRCIAIYGRRGFGKTNLLRLLIRGLLANPMPSRFFLLDDGRNELRKGLMGEDPVLPLDADTSLFSSTSAFKEELIRRGCIPPDRPAGSAQKDREREPRRGGTQRIESGEEMLTRPAAQSGGETPQTVPVVPKPRTVMILQSKKLFLAPERSEEEKFIRNTLPVLLGNADTENYLFLFSDVRPMTEPSLRERFNNNITTAFLLDNIGEFISEKGAKSVFGEFDPREMKAEYARCAVGDGYCFDIDGDRLTKLRFIRDT